jgi:hypothetical protein
LQKLALDIRQRHPSIPPTSAPVVHENIITHTRTIPVTNSLSLHRSRHALSNLLFVDICRSRDSVDNTNDGLYANYLPSIAYVLLRRLLAGTEDEACGLSSEMCVTRGGTRSPWPMSQTVNI